MKRLAVLALCLAACAPTTNTTTNTTASPAASATTSAPSPVEQGALPPPTPADVHIHINAAQDGQSVRVGVNQRFAVELVGVPTAGYLWAPAQMPAFLTRAGDATGDTSTAQSQPGFTGGNHWEVLMFAATGPGSGDLVLEQRRPWEHGGTAAGTFHVTIVAH